MPDALDRLAAALGDRYRLDRELGQGGMATVYLTQDLRHDRRVALKVMRPELAAVIGAERFLQEIKTTAHLQHPHILALFDSGRVDGTVFYVMPFVEGESLRDRLTREKQLPIDDAVRIAREVASALDYAHRHGVIHRDIKPENILLHDGQSLVADFGIALAASAAGGSRLTETGMSLGTPQYMSPEQAMGERTLDARTDIYALGCVLYEMLTGEPPFSGPTAQAIVAKVLTDEPRPPTQLRKSVPEAVEDALLRALEKLPADRFASAAEFGEALGDAETQGRKGATDRHRRRSISASLRLTGLLAAVAASAFLLGGRLLGRGSGPPLEFGLATRVTWDPGLEIQPALSPDGRSVAYAAGTSAAMRIYVRAIAGGRPVRLTDDTLAIQTGPQWSPDGSRILFLARDAVFSAPALGGPARQELPAPPGRQIGWAGWAPDGVGLGFVVGDTVFLRARDGNVRRVATFFEPSRCSWSRSGELLACASGNAAYHFVGSSFGNLSPARIVVCRVKTGAVTTVTDSIAFNHDPIWSSDGRWLYFLSNGDGTSDLYALRMTGAGSAAGTPVRLTTGLNAQSFSLSPDGRRSAYSVYVPKANVWSLPLPAANGPPLSVDKASPVTTGNQLIESVEVSTDGKWLLYDSNLSGNSDLYRMALPRGEPERLSTDPSDDFAPMLSPDGREVAFHSWRAGSRDIYVMPLDGGPVERVTSSPRQEYIAMWSPDGSALSYGELSATGGVWIVHRGKNGSWGTPAQRWGSGTYTRWSPDGRELLVTGRFGGSLQVIPVDSGPGRLLVDADVRSNPRAEQAYWSRDGHTVYFKSHDPKGIASIWSVPIAGGTPHLLVRFDDPNRPSFRANWSLGPDRMYFTIEERESDISVMEVKAR